MNDFENRLLSLIMSFLLVVSMLAAAREAAAYVTAEKAVSGEADKRLCVVVDAGHGGRDPGKIGINGALEKDINLKIALMLKQFLEADDIRVVLTRDSDAGLYDEDASNKKVQDMKRRVGLIEEIKPVLTVSIHQNSYPEEYVRGSQVFYYTHSTEGKKLAELVQEQLTEWGNYRNTRQAKANDSYYLLKKTGTPIVIVECGFLSNAAEAEALCTESCQEKLAWKIHMGIMQYLNEYKEYKAAGE